MTLAHPVWLLGLRLGLVSLAVWLGGQAWVRNLDQACTLDEWPHLERCDAIYAQTPARRAGALQERIRQNPGDSFAVVQLALLANQHPDQVPLDPDQALSDAERLAPQNVEVLLLLANRAIADRAWARAVPYLTRLALHHRNASAAVSLAQLVGLAGREPELDAALKRETAAAPDWLEPVVKQMPGAKVPVVLAMPYLSLASESGRLGMPLSRHLIRQLKAEGQWLDAYSLWLYLWKRPVDLLFNGDFEQPFLAGGFDWEPAQTRAFSAGAQVQRSGRGTRGQVLEVVFTGKAMAPYAVRQDVLLSPGRYVLEGQYLASELRSAQGLVWAVRCARDGSEVARTEALVAEGRSWRSWRLEFDFPPACGLGGYLELKPRASFEAVAGMKGEVLFDNLRLERR